MTEWGNIRISKQIMELAQKVVENSEEGYRNNADLIHHLVREKYRETLKNKTRPAELSTPPFYNGNSEEPEIVFVTEGSQKTIYLLEQ